MKRTLAGVAAVIGAAGALAVAVPGTAAALTGPGSCTGSGTKTTINTTIYHGSCTLSHAGICRVVNGQVQCWQGAIAQTSTVTASTGYIYSHTYRFSLGSAWSAWYAF